MIKNTEKFWIASKLWDKKKPIFLGWSVAYIKKEGEQMKTNANITYISMQSTKFPLIVFNM
jgi:hypothetical protein